MQSEHHANLCCALEVTSDLPSEETIEQWLAEPIKLLILPTSIFLTNSAGFPVLSKRHQQLLYGFFSRSVDLVVCGRPRHDGEMLRYSQYLQHVYSQRPQVHAPAATLCAVRALEFAASGRSPPNMSAPATKIPQIPDHSSLQLSDSERFEQPYWDYLQV